MGAVFLGGMAAGLGNFLGNRASQIADIAVNPLLMYLRYVAQDRVKSSLPDIGTGVAAYYGGKLSKGDLTRLLNFNNFCDWDSAQNSIQKLSAKVTQSWIDSAAPKLSLEQIIYCYYVGIIDDAMYKELASRYKIAEFNQQPLYDLLYGKFDYNTILNNYYRGTWDKQQAVKRMRRFAGVNEGHATQLVDNSAFVPPPGDLIRFAVKSVWNKDEIKEFGLDEEYGEIADWPAWANAQGMTEDVKINYKGKEYSLNVPLAYWISHWNLMSPTQAYEGLHRLRPNRIDRYQKLVPGIKPFEIEQLNKLLKANDYVPSQRKVLAAISYNTLGRIDLRRLYNDNIIDKSELLEQFKDLGYNDTDAGYLVQWSVEQKKAKDDKDKEKENKDKFGKIIAETLLAYEEGSIGREIAFASLSNMLNDAEKANNELIAIDMRVNRKRVRQLIKMVKSAFFTGAYDHLGAYDDLRMGGVDAIRASQYVIIWQRELDRPRRTISIQTVIDWMKRSLITVDDAKKRLQNLGLTNEDTLLYLEMAGQDIRKALAVQSAAAAKTAKQQMSESERLLDKLKAEHRQSQTLMKSYRPLSKLKKWLDIGEITEKEVVETMDFYDIPREDQLRYFVEWGYDYPTF